MFESLLDLLLKSDNLLTAAKKNTLKMLFIGKTMFAEVIGTLKEQTDEGMMDRVRAADKDINNLQIETRKMIYEHLVVSKVKDLLTGLTLNNIIIDLERIGDYTKNIGELSEMFPKKLDFGKNEEAFNELKNNTLNLFDLTKESLENQDNEKANQVINKYAIIGKKCDSEISEVFISNGITGKETVDKSIIAYALILRYIKRVNAHLKNVATAVVNPFHRIGYRRSTP